MTPEEAVQKVRETFPFDDYINGDYAPYLTVGRAVKKHLKPGSRIYDFGSGPCDKTAIAQVLGMHCTAMDDLQDDWHLIGDNIAKIEGFATSMGIELTREFTPLEPESYDMVMMNDVLEHIPDSPRDLLNAMIEGLKPGGLLFVTVPNLANIRKRLDLMRGRTNMPRYDLYYWYPGPWRGPKREYVRGDLTAMTQNLGLEMVELTTVHHMLRNLPARYTGIYKGVTSIFPDWRDTWSLVARKPEGWTPKRELPREDFARIFGHMNATNVYGND